MNRKTFWLILIALHLVFFSKQVFFHNSLIQDSDEYLFAAENLKNHGTLYAWNLNYTYNPDWLTKRPFLYPLILLIFKYLSFGNQGLFFAMVYLAQNLLSLFNIRLALKMAEKKSLKINYLYAAFFLILSVSQLVYANLIMSEIWLQTCFMAMLYLILFRNNDLKKIIYLSLLIIAAMSIKPVMVAAVMIFPLIYLITEFKRFKFLYLAITLMPLLYFIAIGFINEKRTGYRHYSSIGNINLLHYNTYVTLMYKYGTVKADSIIDGIKSRATLTGSYPAKQSYIAEQSSKQIKDHIGLYMTLHLRGVVFALIDPGRFDITQFFNLVHKDNLLYETNKKGLFELAKKIFLNPLGLVLMILMAFNMFRLITAIRFLFKSKYSWWFKLTVMLIPCYILALTGPIGTSRFFMPLVPIAFFIFLLTVSKKETDLESLS